MPDDERAVALEKHRLRQFGKHARPAFERTRAKPRDQQLGARGLCQRREHRGGDPRGSLRTGGIAALVERHAMPVASEAPRDQAAAQAAAEHGEIGSGGTVHRARSVRLRWAKPKRHGSPEAA
ncbi:hypothetical protein OKW39_002807 [Paraburkholderia sp. MM6662-R1]